MRLTRYTDYSLRVLLFLAARDPSEKTNIQEIADAYSISKNHLMKIIHTLGKLGYIETIRGRNGGIRLAKDPRDIVIGQVVRKMEDDFYLVECFSPDGNNCVVSPSCGLKRALGQALHAFLSVLDQYRLSDFLTQKNDLSKLLNIE
ncbi:Rrf2 family transcriptional regulator [Sporolactobacillus sp. THM7-7]|nr:Rrf2 family transcriptional regulator [Sporolactobacillus sp. THM7-7]